MSERNESSESGGSSVLDLLEDYYHIPALVGVLVFMLWTRIQSHSDFVVDGQVYFRGNDPWYQFRETAYLLQNYPNTMPYDVWTGFPYGVHVGQFGTLWDHIAAVAAVLTAPITGGGEAGAMQTMLFMAAVFGMLAAIPTYLIARRFVDRFAAVVGVATLALFSGTFFGYTLVGFPDHHAGEVFFQSVAVFAFLVAFAVAERHAPVWELVVDRDVDALKPPTLYAALAGLALAAYMLTWPPGVMMVGFTGIFLAIKITSDVHHGRSPEPMAFAGSVSMAVTGLLMIVPLEELAFRPTAFSLVQVVLPLGVAAGCILLAWLAREWESRDLDASTYPATVGGLIVVSAGVVWLALPSLWSTVTRNLLRTVAFSSGAGTRTIGEAQPPLLQSGFADFVLSEYGLAFFLALAAVLWILIRPLIRSDDANHTVFVLAAFAVVGSVYAVPHFYGFVGGLVGLDWQVIGLLLATAFLVGATFLVRYDVEELYFVVWAAFIGSAAFTQTRFNYYLAIIVAIGAAYFFQLAVDRLDLNRSIDELRDIEGWQVMTMGAVLVVLFAPLLFMVTPVWAAGAETGPGPVIEWDESLQWMNEETPHPGELEGNDNTMEQYGTYERPPDDDFDYPEGAYGVQSWWDYGHWITTRAERIPNANPFQQNAVEAANYLLAPDEERAADVLEAQSDEGGDTRYVMVDWQMVTPGSKLHAPITFYDDADVAQDDFNWVLWEPVEDGARPTTQIRTQRYYESQMVRLYEYHGSAADPDPIVVNWDAQQFQGADGEGVDLRTVPAAQDRDPVEIFDSVEEAEAFVDEQDGTAQVGGIGASPPERIDALEHYRLVHATESSATNELGYLQQQFRTQQALGVDPAELQRTDPNWVKTFERVPAATVDGTGAEPGAEVIATIEMEKPNGETFEYRQYAEADDTGAFEFTLPYSTTGYDEFGPDEGYTNTSVQATGPYEISSFVTADDGDTPVSLRVDEVDVTEAQVIGEDDTTPTVELTDVDAVDAGGGGTDADTDGAETEEGTETDDAEEDDADADGGDETTDAVRDDRIDRIDGAPIAASTSLSPLVMPHRLVVG